jgi:uncharacterized RDD family membrane protein YckC
VEEIAQGVPIGNTFDSPIGRSVGLGQLVSIIVSNVLVLAGIVMVFFFIAGGIGIISGGSGDNPERAAKGKQSVTFALVGFLVIFAAYWIIQIVEELTGVSILNPGF